MGLFRRNKNNNKPVIKQILDLVPHWIMFVMKLEKKPEKYRLKNKEKSLLIMTYFPVNSCFYDVLTGIQMFFRLFLKTFGC
jgi:hypothetical protein